MDYQLLIIVIISVLALCVVSLAIYLILVLRDIRKTVQTVNKLVLNSKSISSLVAEPVETIAHTIKTVIRTIKEIKEEL